MRGINTDKFLEPFRVEKVDELLSLFDRLRLGEGVVMAKRDLNAALLSAYEAGKQEADTNRPKQYSAQHHYADRYAKMRDLAAYGETEQPITLVGNRVSVLQGDLLDRFLDSIGARA